VIPEPGACPQDRADRGVGSPGPGPTPSPAC
jgi:hypothetical protein